MSMNEAEKKLKKMKRWRNKSRQIWVNLINVAKKTEVK